MAPPLRPWRRPMRARDAHEAHRIATPLELLFDLCFVVAIAQGAAELHHAIVAAHALHGVISFVLVFFAIWWAWMNFTWFASAYDVDDVPYRLKVLVQIVGVLIIAAGVPRAFEHTDFAVVTVGYTVMRVGMIALWLRAGVADEDAARRRTARRYAVGLALVQLGWIAAAVLAGPWWPYAWPLLVIAEISVPLIAERTAVTTWHPHHIVERYGLLALIVIGESVLSSTVAIQRLLDSGHASSEMVVLIAGAVLVLFATWWLYFEIPAHHVAAGNKVSFVWGYGHIVIFGALAATGAGLAAAADAFGGHGAASRTSIAAGVALPIALFLAAFWLLVARHNRRGPRVHGGFLVAIVVTLAGIATPFPSLVAGLALVGLIAVVRQAPPAHA